MIPIDLTGKRPPVAGVGDADGCGWATARRLAEAGAGIVFASWPPC